MLHAVHQLVANFVYLLFCARQVVYSEVLEFFGRKQMPPVAENEKMALMTALRLNQNSKVVVYKTKTMS